MVFYSASKSRSDELHWYAVALKDIDHSARLSAVLHIEHLSLATWPSFLHHSTLFFLRFYCLCQAWYANTMTPMTF